MPVHPALDLFALEFGDGGLLLVLVRLEGGGLLPVDQGAEADDDGGQHDEGRRQHAGPVALRRGDLTMSGFGDGINRAQQGVEGQAGHNDEGRAFPGLDSGQSGMVRCEEGDQPVGRDDPDGRHREIAQRDPGRAGKPPNCLVNQTHEPMF